MGGLDSRHGPGIWLLVMFILAALAHNVASAPVLEDDGMTETQTHMQEYLESNSDASGCYYNFQHYDEGDRIITNEPCLNCTCHNRMLMCYLRVCPFTKAIGQDCTIEKKPDQCCPVITCPEVPVQLLTSSTTTENPDLAGQTAVGHVDDFGCKIDEVFYADGAQVPGNSETPCELCYCIRNRTACVMQECTLKVDGCTPVYEDGVCCPVRYHCDYDQDATIMTTELPAPRPTPGLVLTTTVAGPLDCRHDSKHYADGASIETEEPCEHCYCMKGEIVCAVQECGAPMDKQGQNCTALPPPPGKCCPESYQCDGSQVGDLVGRQNRKHIASDNFTTASESSTDKEEGQATISPTIEDTPNRFGEHQGTEIPVTEAATPVKSTKVEEEQDVTTEQQPESSQPTVEEESEQTPYQPEHRPTVEPIESHPTEPPKEEQASEEPVDYSPEMTTELPKSETELPVDMTQTSHNIPHETETGVHEEGSGEEVHEEGKHPAVTTVLPESNPVEVETSTKINESDDEGSLPTDAPHKVSEVESEQSTEAPLSVASEDDSDNEIFEHPPKPDKPQILHDLTPVEFDFPATQSSPAVIPGEGSCLVDGHTYSNNSDVPPASPCQTSCHCVSSIVHCVLVNCPPAPSHMPNCSPVHHESSCCPTYACDTGVQPTLESESHMTDTSTVPNRYEEIPLQETDHSTEEPRPEENEIDVNHESHEEHTDIPAASYLPQQETESDKGILHLQPTQAPQEPQQTESGETVQQTEVPSVEQQTEVAHPGVSDVPEAPQVHEQNENVNEEDKVSELEHVTEQEHLTETPAEVPIVSSETPQEFLQTDNPASVHEESPITEALDSVTQIVEHHADLPQSNLEPQQTESPESHAEPQQTDAPEIEAEPQQTLAPASPVEPQQTVAPEIEAEPQQTVAPDLPAEPQQTESPELSAEPEQTVAPEFPAEPQHTELPESDAEPQQTVAPELEVESQRPESPESPEPEHTEAPESPTEPQQTVASELTDKPYYTEAPKTSQQTEGPESIHYPESSKAPEDQHHTEAPESQYTEAPEEQHHTDAPEQHGESHQTEAPVVPEDEHHTETPNAPEEPHHTEAPEAAHHTASPEDHVDPYHTESPGAPEEPHQTEATETPKDHTISPDEPLNQHTESTDVPDKQHPTEVPEVPDEPQFALTPETFVEPHHTAVPVAPEEPNYTEYPQATERPSHTDTIELTKEPHYTETPEVPEESLYTEAPETPDEPLHTSAPELSKDPNYSETLPDKPHYTEAPEISKEPQQTDAPELPEISQQTEVPELPEEPQHTELPKHTEEPHLTEAPELPEEPHHTEVPELPEEPQHTEVPEVAEESLHTEGPEVPEEPHHTEAPEVPEEPLHTEGPEMPEEPHHAEAPEQTYAAEVPEEPHHTEAPEVAEETHHTEVPEQPQEPHHTEAPEQTDAPEVSEEPHYTEAPEQTEASELPKKPHHTEAPGHPEEPQQTEAPELPETSHHTEASELPETSHHTEAPELPEVPQDTETPEQPEKPYHTEAPGLSEHTEIPERDHTEAPELSKEPHHTGVPEHPKEPQSTDAPELLEEPEQPVEPHHTEAPELPEEPHHTEAPEEPEQTEAPEEHTEAPEEPEHTEAPGSQEPHYTDTPEVPVEPGHTEAPEQPQEPHYTEAPEVPEEPDHTEAQEKPGLTEVPLISETQQGEHDKATQHPDIISESHLTELPDFNDDGQRPEKTTTLPLEISTALSHAQPNEHESSVSDALITDAPVEDSTKDFQQPSVETTRTPEDISIMVTETPVKVHLPGETDEAAVAETESPESQSLNPLQQTTQSSSGPSLEAQEPVIVEDVEHTEAPQVNHIFEDTHTEVSTGISSMQEVTDHQEHDAPTTEKASQPSETTEGEQPAVEVVMSSHPEPEMGTEVHTLEMTPEPPQAPETDNLYHESHPTTGQPEEVSGGHQHPTTEDTMPDVDTERIDEEEVTPYTPHSTSVAPHPSTEGNTLVTTSAPSTEPPSSESISTDTANRGPDFPSSMLPPVSTKPPELVSQPDDTYQKPVSPIEEEGYDYEKPPGKPFQEKPKPQEEQPSLSHEEEDHDNVGGGEYSHVEDEYDEEQEQPYGPGTCRYAGKVYVSAQQIPRDDPCDFCFCFRSDIICLQQSCPPPIPGCHEEPIQGFCCPRYECHVRMATLLNMTSTTTTTTTTLPPHFLSHAYKGAAQKTGCFVQGRSYRVGQAILSASGPCMDCYCGGDGKMKCEPKVCSPEPMIRKMMVSPLKHR